MSDTKKIVYFVRHGQSEENILPIYQSPDSPLSQAGREQAGSVAERIAKIDFDVLISSPLPRTKETAEAITKITNKIPEYSEKPMKNTGYLIVESDGVEFIVKEENLF